MTSVVVALLTFRRNRQLGDLLPEIVRQARSVEADVAVLVVDNDPDAGARDLVAGWAGSELRYVHEPTPGIAAGRNRALLEATEDLIVFIDDDETPVPGWLAALLATYEAHRPGGVVGPVVRRYDGPVHPWIEAGGFRINTRLPTGTRVEMAATNNLLLDRQVVENRGLRFDPEFGLSGGSDSLFTRQLTLSGSEIIWCDEALVIDPVSAERATRRWALQRAFRLGNTWARVHVRTAGARPVRVAVRARLLVSGLGRVAVGVAMVARGTLGRDLPRRAGGARLVLRGTGIAAGSVGVTYTEYRRLAGARAAR